jgi:hypothetical protein
LEDENESNEEGTSPFNDSDLWGMVGVMEKELKHPLATLLYKEAVKRQVNRVHTFVMNEKPEVTKNGLIGSLIRNSD